MRPTDADGFREAWDILERRWAETVDRARAMDPALLHERVDEQWSFIETLRHLVFATDAWLYRAYLGEPAPWHPLDLPHDDMEDAPGVPRDRSVRPSLDEVLVLRADRMGTVRRVLADLTDEQLAGMTEPVTEPGYPESESFPVARCLGAVVNEEWEHRLYAERDLAVLSARPTPLVRRDAVPITCIMSTYAGEVRENPSSRPNMPPQGSSPVTDTPSPCRDASQSVRHSRSRSETTTSPSRTSREIPSGR